jgi:acetoin utilization deacetylase AcuC-like enzyme
LATEWLSPGRFTPETAMRCAYHADYYLPLPPHHPFPMAKYPLLFDRLLGNGVIAPKDVAQPVEASLDNLRLVHARVLHAAR